MKELTGNFAPLYQEIGTAWKMSKYGVFSGPYFPVFSPNTGTGKYGPEKPPYLDTFHAVRKSDFSVYPFTYLFIRPWPILTR